MTKTFTSIIICLLIGIQSLKAQFPPRAGEVGTTAIHINDIEWAGWAIDGTLNRGPMDISQPALGLVSAGTIDAAYGKATENGVVSLGDGGTVILRFDPPIIDGPGFDFAVFENGFLHIDSLDFLELAFVEVSSDGNYFVRFPAVSLTQNLFQNNPFEGLNATRIHNLAGKYTLGYGTPFDLNELANHSGLDVQHITHIKIIDVVGNIDTLYASKDHQENIINDPWPTPYPTGGFDLDAIGAIYNNTSKSIIDNIKNSLLTFPNPGKKNDIFWMEYIGTLYIYDLNGKIITEIIKNEAYFTIPENIPAGFYILSSNETNISTRLCITE